MNKNQSGFSALIVLLIVIMVGAIGFVGWRAWHTSHAKQASATNAVTTPKKQLTFLASSDEPASDLPLTIQVTDNIMHPPSSYTTYNLRQFATTPDQQAIAKTLQIRCSQFEWYNDADRSKIAATGDQTTFSDPRSFVEKGQFARLEGWCVNTANPQVDEGTGRTYLFKKDNGAWKEFFDEQMDPSCDQVDGIGMPAGVIKCYATSGYERDPRP